MNFLILWHNGVNNLIAPKLELDMNKKLIIYGIVVLVVVFYWFQLRPSQIRKNCMTMAQKGIRVGKEQTQGFDSDKFRAERGYLSEGRTDQLYLSCLRIRGLER